VSGDGDGDGAEAAAVGQAEAPADEDDDDDDEWLLADLEQALMGGADSEPEAQEDQEQGAHGKGSDAVAVPTILPRCKLLALYFYLRCHCMCGMTTCPGRSVHPSRSLPMWWASYSGALLQACWGCHVFSACCGPHSSSGI